MPDVNMPKLSDTMEEGTIVEWKKSSGDEVHKGEVLAEVESDKATFDLEAEDDGKLEILVEKGVPAKIGAPIARIGAGAETQTQEKPAPKPKAEKKPEPKAEPEAEPKVEPKAETKAESAEQPAGKEAPEQPPTPSPTPEPKKAAAPAAERPRAPDSDGQGAREIRASPLARRLAEEMGVDLGAVTGTGPEGRVVKEDVIAAAGTARKDRRRPDTAQPTGPEVEPLEPTRMQATIARRMAESKATVPDSVSSSRILSPAPRR